MMLTKSNSSVIENASNKESILEDFMKEKFMKIMEDFKVFSRDFHLNDSFEEDDGEKFP